jgi:hypothetical protein
VLYGDSGQATSATRTNWYPINFYDTREGETRDVAVANNSAAAVGVMNAIEIDVGNLKRWLWGQIGANGGNVDFQTQNGWVLYFSDRRGMLPNPNFAGNPKTGDSGLEDSINAASAAGVPDGVLEPKSAGKKYSPEDVNQDGVLDNFLQEHWLGVYTQVSTSTPGSSRRYQQSVSSRIANSWPGPQELRRRPPRVETSRWGIRNVPYGTLHAGRNA